MPPKYSLQSILDYHKNRVELLEMELGALNHRKTEIEAVIEYLTGRKQSLYEELISRQEGELDMDMIAHLRRNLNLTQTQIDEQYQNKKRIEAEIVKKQVEVVEAKKEEAVYEKLKEKEIEKWQEKMDQVEKETLSDIYISQAFRQTAANARFGENHS